jgi:hypothetical protein
LDYLYNSYTEFDWLKNQTKLFLNITKAKKGNLQSVRKEGEGGRRREKEGREGRREKREERREERGERRGGEEDTN